MRIFNAQIVTPENLLPEAGLVIDSGRIQEILPHCSEGDLDLEGAYLLPGLVDMHTHPQSSVADSPEKLAELCACLRDHGTGAFLFAPANTPVPELPQHLRELRRHLEALEENAACVGIYLEGPYVEAAARGGFQPSAICSPEEMSLETLIEACGPWLKYINISPGLPGAAQAIRRCREKGLTVSLGHSAARREDLIAAEAAGANTICHIFNASAIQSWKEPGVLDLSLDLLGLSSPQFTCEVICDGVHVDPYLVRLLYQNKGADGIALITDSVLGGAPAEEGSVIQAGATQYTVRDGVGRLPDGGLAGSTLSMAQALTHFMRFSGATLVEATRSAATIPARLLGIGADYGAIQAGARAVFCVLNHDYQLNLALCRHLNNGEKG